MGLSGVCFYEHDFNRGGGRHGYRGIGLAADGGGYLNWDGFRNRAVGLISSYPRISPSLISLSA